MSLRVEIAASGVDEALQGLTSDPFAASQPTASGLRIPAVLPGDGGDVGKRPRYLFLLASRTITAPTRIVGARQGVTIGCDANFGTPPFRPVQLWVQTPNFSFIDGNISWHIVREPNPQPTPRLALTDSASWRKTFSDGPAMLYDTFTNTNVGTNGEPLIYPVGLTAYTPPQTQQTWQSLGGDLGCFRDLRFPWDADHAWESLDIPVEGNCRISFYVSVLQTNPATRPNAVFADPVARTTGGVSDPIEEVFIQNFTSGGGDFPVVGPAYWKVFGSLIFKDEGSAA